MILKINKRWGWKIFEKLIRGGGVRLFKIQEYLQMILKCVTNKEKHTMDRTV